MRMLGTRASGGARAWFAVWLVLVAACMGYAPPAAAAYKYCAGWYGTLTDVCAPLSGFFDTPEAICEADLKIQQSRDTRFTWSEKYIPGPDTPMGYKLYGVCHRWTDGPNHYGFSYFAIARVGSGPSADIRLSGPSRTKALPAGPVLPQVATVTEGGIAVAGKSVSITISGVGTLSGVTNGAGQFAFTYVPPRQQPTTATVTATCTDCAAPATKQIFVEHCDDCSN